MLVKAQPPSSPAIEGEQVRGRESGKGAEGGVGWPSSLRNNLAGLGAALEQERDGGELGWNSNAPSKPFSCSINQLPQLCEGGQDSGAAGPVLHCCSPGTVAYPRARWGCKVPPRQHVHKGTGDTRGTGGERCAPAGSAPPALQVGPSRRSPLPSFDRVTGQALRSEAFLGHMLPLLPSCAVSQRAPAKHSEPCSPRTHKICQPSRG